MSQEHIDTAIAFGVEFENTNQPLDAKMYLIAFFRKLLLQREKLDQGLLADQLKPSITKIWQEVLSCLEEKKRKIMDIQPGSVIFTLFCPTLESLLHLQSENWKEELLAKLQTFLKNLGNEITNLIG